MSIIGSIFSIGTKVMKDVSEHVKSATNKKKRKSHQTDSDEFNAWREDNPDIFISDQDLSLAQTNSYFASDLIESKEGYRDADAIGDEEGKNAYWKQLEASRKDNGGYSGGVDGSAYIVGDSNVQPAGLSGGVISGNPASVNDVMLVTTYGNNQSYADQAAIYEKKLKETERLAEEQIGTAVRQGTRQLNTQKKDIERAYKDSARQAYVSYMQNKRDIPQQLRTVGITGGAAESTLLGAQTAYQKQLQKTEVAKNQAIADIDLAVENLRASGDLQTAQYVLNNAEKIAESYLQAGMNDIARNDALALQEAQLTGIYNGQKTLAYQQAEYNKDFSESKMWRNFEGMREHGWTDEQIQSANAQYAPQAYQSYRRKTSNKSSGGDAYDPNGGYNPDDYNMDSILDLQQGPIDLATAIRMVTDKKAEIYEGPNGKVSFRLPGVINDAGVSETNAMQTQGTPLDASKINLESLQRAGYGHVKTVEEVGQLIKEGKIMITQTTDGKMWIQATLPGTVLPPPGIF